jgi:hypothetical protein
MKLKKINNISFKDTTDNSFKMAIATCFLPLKQIVLNVIELLKYQLSQAW